MEGSEKAEYPLPGEDSYPHRPEERVESAHQQQQQTNLHLNLPYPHQSHPTPPHDEIPRPYQTYQHVAPYPPLQQPYTGAPATSSAPAPVPLRYAIDRQMKGHSTPAPAVTPVKQNGGRVRTEDALTGQVAPSSTAERKVRLRKACDCCSHRKVKVVHPFN